MTEQTPDSPTGISPLQRMAINFLLITIGCGLTLAGGISAASMVLGGKVSVPYVAGVVLAIPGAYLLFKTMRSVVVGSPSK